MPQAYASSRHCPGSAMHATGNPRLNSGGQRSWTSRSTENRRPRRHATGHAMTRQVGPWTVLFLCPSNASRSILAEAALKARAGNRFHALSAGPTPAARVVDLALQTIRAAGLSIDGLTPKSWDGIAGSLATPVDFVFAVCDPELEEACTAFPDAPLTAIWPIADPARVEGDLPRRRAFVTTMLTLQKRIDALVGLPDEALAQLTVARQAASMAALAALSADEGAVTAFEAALDADAGGGRS